MNGSSWIETYTGRKVHPFDVKSREIYLLDIAVALSHLCRFTGHCQRFYSVGQHSIHVAELVYTQTSDEDTVRAALLHDASEAYLNDLSSPVKKMLPSYKDAEQRMQQCIEKKFHCSQVDHGVIKWADSVLILNEAEQLMDSQGKDWGQKVHPMVHKEIPDWAMGFVVARFLETFRVFGGRA